MVTFGDVHQQMSGKNSNWLSDIKQCIHYKEPDLDCTLVRFFEICSMIPWEHKISTIYVKRLFAYDTYKKNTLHFTCLSILK